MTGYRISGLPISHFESLFGATDAALRERDAVRVTADKKPGFPCRITLEDAEPGETLILTNYEHQNAASPFRSSHAVYVREGAAREAVFEGEVPVYLSQRLLSVRAFDETGMMIDSDITPGEALEPMIEQMFAQSRAAYLHLHSARPGCFVARVDRA